MKTALSASPSSDSSPIISLSYRRMGFLYSWSRSSIKPFVESRSTSDCHGMHQHAWRLWSKSFLSDISSQSSLLHAFYCYFLHIDTCNFQYLVWSYLSYCWYSMVFSSDFSTFQICYRRWYFYMLSVRHSASFWSASLYHDYYCERCLFRYWTPLVHGLQWLQTICCPLTCFLCVLAYISVWYRSRSFPHSVVLRNWLSGSTSWYSSVFMV